MRKPYIVFDTNAIIAIIKGRPITSIPAAINAAISIITRIELLSYPYLSPTDKFQINLLLKKFKVIPLNKQVEKTAILVRSETKLKLPDSIIVATALSLNALLLSDDSHLLTLQRPGLRVQKASPI